MASVAAEWAGFVPRYAETVSGSETLQRWDPKPYVYEPATAAQRADSERWQLEREAAILLAARKRQTEVE